MGHPDRLDRATRGRRAARRTRDTFNLYRHRGVLSRRLDPAVGVAITHHHRRFQSNLQCRVLRVPFASPREMAGRDFIAELHRVSADLSYVTQPIGRSHTSRIRSRDCFFHRRMRRFTSLSVVPSVLPSLASPHAQKINNNKVAEH